MSTIGVQTKWFQCDASKEGLQAFQTNASRREAHINRLNEGRGALPPSNPGMGERIENEEQNSCYASKVLLKHPTLFRLRGGL